IGGGVVPSTQLVPRPHQVASPIADKALVLKPSTRVQTTPTGVVGSNWVSILTTLTAWPANSVKVCALTLTFWLGPVGGVGNTVPPKPLSKSPWLTLGRSRLPPGCALRQRNCLLSALSAWPISSTGAPVACVPEPW